MEWNGLREWSLITGRGRGATKWERVGHVKLYPYEKGGGQKSFRHAEVGRAQQVLEKVLRVILKF